MPMPKPTIVTIKQPEKAKEPEKKQVLPPKVEKNDDMSLVNCKVCKKQVASAAEMCPHCGIQHPGRSELDIVGYKAMSGVEGLGRILVVVMLVFILVKCVASH